MSRATLVRGFAIFIVFGTVLLSATFCHTGAPAKPTFKQVLDTAHHYLNINDTVTYVGEHTCMLCHQNIFNTFDHTGMGKSFGAATREKSSARFGKHEVVYDSAKDFYYHPFWKNDSLYILEYRTLHSYAQHHGSIIDYEHEDTIYKRVQQVNYIIGSGQHTNSHIYKVNGYLYQAPITFYTQKGVWDLAPGFSDGFNSRFKREVGLECMNCHNSYPDFVQGSTNKFVSVPNGIACERCHGPGSLHVAAIQLGHIVDTSKAIDYTIVNPAKLPMDLQVDVCQRCHLQGNSVLKPGKSYFDFRPGMHLASIMDVFMPKYAGMDDEYIMASHIARLKMSKCYINSINNTGNTLKPYKNGMTCVTCHNPHIDVRNVSDSSFNVVCQSCHSEAKHNYCKEILNEYAKTKDPEGRSWLNRDCVGCHMPKGNTIDIPHVITTDHYIRIPVKNEEKEKVKQFLTLYDVNNPNPDNETKGKAFILQFARFQSDFPALLDSAKHYFSDGTADDIKKNFSELVAISFYKNDYKRVLDYVNSAQQQTILTAILTHKDYDNTDAWTAYRIGEAYVQTGDINSANLFYKKATELAPFVLEFQNKLGTTQVQLNKIAEAQKTFDYILEQNPQFISALTNSGYIAMMQGNTIKAKQYYEKALALDPDDKQALMNTAGWYIYKKDFKDAKEYLQQIIDKYPDDLQAKGIMEKLKGM
jgi:tetratricopeptide (TPR) repeat protein